MTISKVNFGRIYLAGQKSVGSNYFLALHKTDNGGSTWTHTQISTTAGSAGYAVAVQPTNDNVIYVGGIRSGVGVLYKSTNGGSTWTRITGTIKGLVRAIAIDPNTPSRIYVATDDGLYKSENGGSSWTRKLSTGTNCIKINPVTPSSVYIGGWNGVYKSSDYGNTWADYSEGLIVKDILGLDIDASQRILYAATSGGSICKRSY